MEPTWSIAARCKAVASPGGNKALYPASKLQPAAMHSCQSSTPCSSPLGLFGATGIKGALRTGCFSSASLEKIFGRLLKRSTKPALKPAGIGMSERDERLRFRVARRPTASRPSQTLNSSPSVCDILETTHARPLPREFISWASLRISLKHFLLNCPPCLVAAPDSASNLCSAICPFLLCLCLSSLCLFLLLLWVHRPPRTTAFHLCQSVASVLG